MPKKRIPKEERAETVLGKHGYAPVARGKVKNPPAPLATRKLPTNPNVLNRDQSKKLRQVAK